MSNHYHIVIRINAEEKKQWSDKEVAKRWMQIFSGPLLMHQYLANADLTSAELKCTADTGQAENGCRTGIGLSRK